MNTFAPELTSLWLAGLAVVARTDAHPEANDDDADREEAALKELADRVSAARSIV